MLCRRGPHCLDQWSVATTKIKRHEKAEKIPNTAYEVARKPRDKAIPDTTKYRCSSTYFQISHHRTTGTDATHYISSRTWVRTIITCVTRIGAVGWDVTMQVFRSRCNPHCVEAFRHMVSKSRPNALPGLETRNNSSVLSVMEWRSSKAKQVGNP